MTELITKLFSVLAEIFGVHSAVLLVSFLPMAEARLSLPLSLSYGLNPAVGFTLSYIGSSLPAFIVLPLLKFIIGRGKGKLKSNLTAMYSSGANTLKQKARKRNVREGTNEFDPNSMKVLVLLGSFVALPLPLTGVWSGIIIACLLSVGALRGGISIAAGNLTACGLLLIFSLLFAPYIDLIVTIITITVLVTATIMLIRTIRRISKGGKDKTDKRKKEK